MQGDGESHFGRGELDECLQVGMPSGQSGKHVWGSGGKTGLEIPICCSIWVVVYYSEMSNFNSVYILTHEQVCETQKVLKCMQKHSVSGTQLVRFPPRGYQFLVEPSR